MALKLLFDKGHLQVTMADTETLINTNRETWITNNLWLQCWLPFRLHTLAVRTTLKQWAKKEELAIRLEDANPNSG